jgi:hypothetical protein
MDHYPITICLAMLFLNRVYNCQADQLESSTSCSEMQPYCNCHDYIPNVGYKLICAKFDYFVELNFTSLANRTFNYFSLEPQKPNILNKNNLNLHNMNTNGLVYLHKIESFDMDSNPFEHITRNRVISQLSIFESNLLFVDINNSKCDSQLRKTTLFSKFRRMIIYNGTFNMPLCPFVFHNSDLEFVYIDKYQDKFEFEQLSANEGASLNSSIFEFKIIDSKITILDERILEKYTFKQIQRFELVNTYLEMIADNGVFVNFTKLKKIILGLNNMKSFMGKLGNNKNWLSSLRGSQAQQLLVTLSDTGFDNLYTYPEGDFCKLVAFAPDNNVFVSIQNGNNYRYECTCTLLWLLQNVDNYTSNSVDINNTYVQKCLGANFKESMELCQFERKICECDGSCLNTLTNNTFTVENNNQNNLIAILGSIILIVIVLPTGIYAVYYIWRRNRHLMEENEG